MILSISHDGESLILTNGNEQVGQPIKTGEEFVAMIEDVGSVMCSSTMDFPEEANASDEMIALCHRIRGA